MLGFNSPENPADVTALPPSINVSWSASRGELTFTGAADRHAYETALSLVRYNNANATRGSVFTGPGRVTEGLHTFQLQVTLVRTADLFPTPTPRSPATATSTTARASAVDVPVLAVEVLNGITMNVVNG